MLTNIGSDGRIAPPTDKQVLNNRANQSWHHDSSFKPVPAREITAEGSNTEFASMRAAYMELPKALKAAVQGRTVIHDFGWSRSRVDPALVSEAERADWPPVRHPMVVTSAHGPALYLGAHARMVEVMGKIEGRTLIERLMAFDPAALHLQPSLGAARSGALGQPGGAASRYPIPQRCRTPPHGVRDDRR